MFMTLTGELSWQRLRRSAVDFYSKKQKKSLFEPPFRGLRVRGNVRTLSIARWKARGRLYIRHNWTFFRYLLQLRRYKRKRVEVGVSRITFSADFRGKGASSTNHCWCQLSDCPFVWYQNICSAPFRFVTIHACGRQTDTDGRTDGQTELLLPRLPSHYARAVKNNTNTR